MGVASTVVEPEYREIRLRSECMFVALHSVVYIWRTVFHELQVLPLSWTQGNLDVNINGLMHMDLIDFVDPFSYGMPMSLESCAPRFDGVHVL